MSSTMPLTTKIAAFLVLSVKGPILFWSLTHLLLFFVVVGFFSSGCPDVGVVVQLLWCPLFCAQGH